MALTETQRKFLQGIGFPDRNGDGRVEAKELPSYKKAETQANQKAAFELLAGAAGAEGSTYIDGNDLEKLNDPSVLARLIHEDPTYKGHFLKGDVLEYLKKGAGYTSGINSQGIEPIAARRITSYLQHSLNVLFPAQEHLREDGVFGDETKAAVDHFQTLMGITTGEEGNKIGRSTLGALILSLNSNSVLRDLDVLKAKIAPKGEAPKPGQTTPISVYDLLKGKDAMVFIRAMQLAFPEEVSPYLEVFEIPANATDKERERLEATRAANLLALQEQTGQAVRKREWILIGPKTIEELERSIHQKLGQSA